MRLSFYFFSDILMRVLQNEIHSVGRARSPASSSGSLSLSLGQRTNIRLELVYDNKQSSSCCRYPHFSGYGVSLTKKQDWVQENDRLD